MTFGIWAQQPDTNNTNTDKEGMVSKGRGGLHNKVNTLDSHSYYSSRQKEALCTDT